MEQSNPLETVIINPPETAETAATPTGSVVYGKFGRRILAYMVDSGLNSFVIPIFFSIFYYFRDGQTLGYKVMGLKVKHALDEEHKPSKRRLFGRWLAKGYGIVFIIAIVRFLVSIVFFGLGAESGLTEQQNVIRGFINRGLGVLTIFGGALLMLISRVTIPFTQKNKGIHDMIAKTVVHRVAETKKGRLVVGIILFIVGLIAGAAISASGQVAVPV